MVTWSALALGEGQCSNGNKGWSSFSPYLFKQLKRKGQFCSDGNQDIQKLGWEVWVSLFVSALLTLLKLTHKPELEASLLVP